MKQFKMISTFACLLAMPLARAEEKPALPEKDAALEKRIAEMTHRHEAAVMDLPIGFHEIRGLAGHSQWHILGTHWWVALHPAHRGEKLDKTRQYVVHGVPLEQRYGVIDIWAYSIKEK
jgi:superfamily I DNA and RNA helicase